RKLPAVPSYLAVKVTPMPLPSGGGTVPVGCAAAEIVVCPLIDGGTVTKAAGISGAELKVSITAGLAAIDGRLRQTNRVAASAGLTTIGAPPSGAAGQAAPLTIVPAW